MKNIKNNLDNEILNEYLRCPVCRKEKSLSISEEKHEIFCMHCREIFGLKHGIPALLLKNEANLHSQEFMEGILQKEEQENPYKTLPNRICNLIIGEIFYFLVAVSFLFKYGLKRILKNELCYEVNRALYYGWKNYFNLILKSGEIVAFNKMIKYINEPSLEIGCGASNTTNMIFRDRLDSITFGCEYFMDTYLLNILDESTTSELSPEMFRLIKYYVGGSVKSLPFASGVFNSVFLVHIIDHIVDLGAFLTEINRIIKPGGFLVVSGYSQSVFDNLPGVKLRGIFSKHWAEKYKSKRISAENPYRGGISLMTKNDYYVTGANIIPLDDWRNIAASNEFELVDYVFFGKLFSFFMDLEYRGYRPSIFFSGIIYSAISKMIEEEKINPCSEKESTNMLLVLEKKV